MEKFFQRKTTSRHLQPDCLTRVSKSFMAKISPTRSQREIVHFGKRKRSRHRQPAVELCHWFAKQGRGQKINADRAEYASPQIRNKNKLVRKFATALKHSNRVIVAEMMERQGAQCHIVPLIGFPIQNVRFNEMNVLIIRAQAFRDFQGRRLLVYSVNRHVSIDLSSVVCDQARDVPEPVQRSTTRKCSPDLIQRWRKSEINL